MDGKRLSEKLLQIAARRSVESPLGWAHPDCEVLEEAARIVRGDPPKRPDDGRATGVLAEVDYANPAGYENI